MADNQRVTPNIPPDDGSHPRGPLINTSLAARILMKEPERVRQLAKAGWIEQQGDPSDRRYRLLDVVQGYIRFRDDEDKRTSRSAAHSRISDARSRDIELRNLQREGRLIELEEAIAVIEGVIALLRLQISGLPARVTRDLQFRRTIEAAINDILDSVADLAAERAQALGARRAISASITPHRAGSMGGSQSNPPADVGSAGTT